MAYVKERIYQNRLSTEKHIITAYEQKLCL